MVPWVPWPHSTSEAPVMVSTLPNGLRVASKQTTGDAASVGIFMEAGYAAAVQAADKARAREQVKGSEPGVEKVSVRRAKGARGARQMPRSLKSQRHTPAGLSCDHMCRRF